MLELLKVLTQKVHFIVFFGLLKSTSHIKVKVKEAKNSVSVYPIREWSPFK